jgi:hypothetical protein
LFYFLPNLRWAAKKSGRIPPHSAAKMPPVTVTAIRFDSSPKLLSHKGAIQALNAFAEKLNVSAINLDTLQASLYVLRSRLGRTWRYPSSLWERRWVVFTASTIRLKVYHSRFSKHRFGRDLTGIQRE